jgi:serine-aspartate repeat-containing protein C/D/E
VIFSSLVRRMPQWLRRGSLRAAPMGDAYKRCQLEPLEKRSLMAADIHLGAVYFEEATGDDSAGDRIEVTFQGGEAGTQLTQIIIDTDKDGLGLSTGDLFFDTQSGGLGAFKNAGLNIQTPQGFTVVSSTVTDGGTRLVINLSGFDAGEKLVFTIDVDEAQFVNGNTVDVNSLVEGGEFQRSKLTGTFSAPHFYDATGTGSFFDAYDNNFAQAAAQNGTQLGLPPDNYIPPDNADRTDRTAGAVVLIAQQSLPVSLAGTVYHDVNLNNARETGELGISGVVLQLWRKNVDGSYTFTGDTTTTDAQGNYKFDILEQGVFGVVEAQPATYFSVGAQVGTVNGTAVGRVETVDSMYDVNLRGGQHGVRYDFGEAKQAELHGHVYYDADNDGVFDSNEVGIGGAKVIIQYLPTTGVQPAAIEVFTNADGSWSATGLRPGSYRVTEVTPAGYFDGLDRAGDAGGTATNPGDLISGVFLAGGQVGRNYDFGELLPATLSGRVHADLNGDCTYQSGEPLIAGVQVQLFDSAGNLVQTTTTDANGVYKFTGLAPGVYSVFEVQPAGYFDGGEAVGTAGGSVTGNDRVGNINLLPGVNATGYDFCEKLPASLSGRVHADANGDCIFQPGEQLLSGVEVRLFDSNGNVVATTTTGADGVYKFSNLAPGTYSVFEVQPSGYFDGGEKVGTAGGNVTGDDRVGGITLGSGVNATGYDFCENVPVSLSGYVFVDLNDNCMREQGETGIAGVTITLLDANGNNTNRTTTTDANGFYRFDGLAPGVYGVAEAQPTSYVDGQDCPGTAGGENDGNDRITGAMLNPGVNGQEYNFGELIPSSISGRVHADKNGDCTFQEGEQPLAGVQIQLRDNAGNVIATAVTGADGVYVFNGLAPGVYQVFEVQPGGYFDGGEKVGSAGGTVGGNDLITSITLGPGITATGYDFCENEPVSLSGYVYVDLDNDGVRDVGETGIAGVTLALLDANGAPTMRTVTTDANGFYRFDGLAPGVYGVTEVQPTAYIDGLDAAGNAGGSAQNPGDTITGATLNAGLHGVEYNFGELLPATIRGRVHGDLNGDCVYQEGELLLGGVTIELRNAAGTVIATTTTASDGTYSFGGLAPGVYSVFEVQPAGYFDGGENVGTAGGVAGNDLITGITLAAGVNATDYNFCEKLPASIAGRVFSDPNADTIYDASTGSTPIAGAVIELLDSAGNVIATTTTDANGEYRFTGLAPGVYRLRELQPDGYFDGDEVVGNAGGELGGNDLMVNIELSSGENGVEYNFAELPPATLSGYVYQDGPTIFLDEGETLNVGDVRDGTRTGDDTPLAGVTLRLTDEFGNALTDTFGNVIETVTDSSGYYQFTGLRQGRYGVVQVQPDGYIDGIDTAGTLGGAASNGQPVAAGAGVDLFNPTLYPPNADAIYGIQVDYGQHGAEYNFSEVITATTPPPPIIENPPFLPPTIPQNIALPMPAPLAFPAAGPAPRIPGLTPLPTEGAGGGGSPFSWHLSVIDAGYPRGRAENQTPDVRFTGMQSELFAWRKNAEMLGKSRWTVRRESPGRDMQIVFGAPDSIPVTGDFNGDGKAEVGVYIGGEWFIDLNGNGLWDDDDLWAKLGKKDDLPVVGDWDGDGKSDIGIYGPEWIGDSRAVAAEPGLPDAQNQPTKTAKNLPPRPEDATMGERWMKLTAAGQSREDVIDHVFYYGNAPDTPVAGDWNGDGVDTIGHFRNGRWRLDVDGTGRHSRHDVEFRYGQAGDRPVVGDFNRDGVDEIGVFRDGKWYIDTDGDRELTDRDLVIDFGQAGDQPIVEDFDADGEDELGVYRDGELDSREL